MKELSEVKDSLDMEVKQNFIDPLQNLHDKDLREIQVLFSMWHFLNARCANCACVRSLHYFCKSLKKKLQITDDLNLISFGLSFTSVFLVADL